MNDRFFSFTVSLPEQEAWVTEAFLEQLKSNFEHRSFAGIYEEIGVESLETTSCTIYFSGQLDAEACAKWVEETFAYACSKAVLEEQKDWNEAWNNSFSGVEIGNDWKIVPMKSVEDTPSTSNVTSTGWPKNLFLNAGAGFGSGTHPTTRLCLTALRQIESLPSKHVLDFGSGSGILSIAASLMGAKRVDAVEIDPLAIENATYNASLNRAKISFHRSLREVPDGSYDLIMANILAPVLLEHATALCKKLNPKGAMLILSGCVESDREEIVSKYRSLLGDDSQHQVTNEEDWLCILFTPHEHTY